MICSTALEKDIEKTIRAKRETRKKDKFGKTPLHYAVISRDIERVKILIEQGADIAACDNNHITPLHFAMGKTLDGAEIEIAKTLIENNANINATTNKGMTPLHFAVLTKQQYQNNKASFGKRSRY